MLHYDQFFTDVNVGSDADTGGYVMAKRNASKTCDAFVNNDCMLKSGGDKCMADVINAFLAALQPLDTTEDSTNVLAIALPVTLGGAALIAVVVLGIVLLGRRRRSAAAAAAAATKQSLDLESAGGGKGATALAASNGAVGLPLAHGSKGAESSSSGSKETMTSSEDNTDGNGQPRGTTESFRYETNDDMGRCLSGNRGAGNRAHSCGSSGTALIEGVMDDGSVCTVAVGAPLGQGSYGVVFKGFWRSKAVAVKLILCDKNCSEQVATEVRLMTSEACRHPNLLQAYTCMTRTKMVNRQHPATQALQSTITTLSSTARNRREAEQPDSGSGSGSGSRVSDIAKGSELVETWIVSEYCDLGALAPHVHGAKRLLSPPEGSSGCRRPRLAPILTCLRDMAAGMAHLHSLNIVHGDLKLANVLLSSRGSPDQLTGEVSTEQPLQAASSEPYVETPYVSSSLMQLPAEMVAKVADFGLSRWLKEGQTHHSTKTVGTVTHMPPELLRSGKLALSGDVYSFGIIMWEVLTGLVPYRGLMYGEVVERVVVSHRRPEFPAHTPLSYRALAERCWAAEASARPTFAAVHAELEAMLAAVPALQAESDMVALPSPQGSAAAPSNPGSGGGAGGAQAPAVLLAPAASQ